MRRIEQIRYLNQILLEEMPEYCPVAATFPKNEAMAAELTHSCQAWADI